MATILAVPLKKSYDVDLVKPLRNLISSQYNTADSGDDYRDALTELNKLRNTATWKALDKHETSLDGIYRYYDQLNALEAKVPPQDIQVPFKWKDAFDKGSLFGARATLTASSIAYEKVCVLFNIAALLSQVAANENQDSDEGLKKAAKWLQMSCGIFGFLKGNILSSIQQEPTPDLQPDTLGCLSSLMLAQAQESFFLKASQDKMKDVIIAKIAAQAEELYADALKQMQRDTVRTLWERDWVPIVASKQTTFHALAEYHQSLVCKAEKNVGEELARLTHALELIKTAESRAGLAPNTRERIQLAFDEAKKDNDFIYHVRVPDVKTLAPIGKAALAKPLGIPAQFSSNFRDLFGSLVPVPVHQALAAFDVRKTEIVNAEISKLREQTQLMNSILASLNLPAALEDVSGDSVPPSVAEKAKAVRDAGGIDAIEKLMNELPDLLTRNREILDEAERMLNDEQQSDSQLRTQFGDRWRRTSSDKLTEPMRVNAAKYRQIINTAMQADGVVREKFTTHRSGMGTLSKPEKELQSAIPSANPTKVLQSSASVQRLRKLMQDVEAIKTDRDAIETELKNVNVDMRTKFLQVLNSDGGINEPVLSTEALGESYGPLQKRVRESVTTQEQLMSEVEKVNLEFCKEKESSQNASRREATLRELASAHDAYMELTANLQEGTRFYNDLTQLLLNFQSKVSDFCFARKTEKEELMRDLQQTIANQPVAEAPTPPAHHAQTTQTKQVPPRPPPPVFSAPAPPPISAVPSQPPMNPAPSSAGSAALPYPVMPSGMPMPQPYNPYQYPAPTYPYAAPMPGGYNPYGSVPYPGYPYPAQVQQPYPGYPVPPPNQQTQ